MKTIENKYLFKNRLVRQNSRSKFANMCINVHEIFQHRQHKSQQSINVYGALICREMKILML